MYNGGHMFGFGWGFMWIFWILVIVAIIWMIKSFAGNSDKNNGQEKASKSAEEILKERYARGEIDREEFEQKRKDLNS